MGTATRRPSAKWGDKRWPPRENVVRDSGILYYAVEVLWVCGTCVHAVNGKVNLVLTNPLQPAPGGRLVPLTGGPLQIQSEGAEVYDRNVAIRRITEFPEGYRP